MYTKNFGCGPKWITWLVQEITGSVSYTVIVGDSRGVRRHGDPEPVTCNTKPSPAGKELPQDTGTPRPPTDNALVKLRKPTKVHLEGNCDTLKELGNLQLILESLESNGYICFSFRK